MYYIQRPAILTPLLLLLDPKHVQSYLLLRALWWFFAWLATNIMFAVHVSMHGAFLWKQHLTHTTRIVLSSQMYLTEMFASPTKYFVANWTHLTILFRHLKMEKSDHYQYHFLWFIYDMLSWLFLLLPIWLLSNIVFTYHVPYHGTFLGKPRLTYVTRVVLFSQVNLAEMFSHPTERFVANWTGLTIWIRHLKTKKSYH